MPGFDRTGPLGAGSRAGWGRGPCGQETVTRRFSSGGFFRGMGRGGFPGGEVEDGALVVGAWDWAGVLSLRRLLRHSRRKPKP